MLRKSHRNHNNEDGTEVTSFQVHPDASSMELHIQLFRQYMETSYGEFLDAPTMLLVCGEGDTARQTIRQLTPPGFSVVEMPQHIGGFTRPVPAGCQPYTRAHAAQEEVTARWK